MWRRRLFEAGASAYDWLTWQERWRDHCRSMVDHLHLQTERPRILDLGVGPGISALGLLDRLPEATVVGVDLATRMMATARKRIEGRVSLVQADASHLPFADASFDAVTGHSFLYLLPDRSSVVREISRVLRPAGHCAFLEPNARPPRGVWRRIRGPLRFRISMVLWRVASSGAGRFEPATLQALLDEALLAQPPATTLHGLGLIGTARKPLPRIDETGDRLRADSTAETDFKNDEARKHQRRELPLTGQPTRLESS